MKTYIVIGGEAGGGVGASISAFLSMQILG